MSWEYIRLGDVCTKIGSGATPKGGATVYIDEGTSFIRSQNIYNLEFSHEGLAHITEEAAKKLNGVAVQKDDVLINITGDSVARTCMVPDAALPARVNQHVAIVRPDSNRLNPRFLNYYLTSPYMQSLMLGLAVGKGASRNAMTKDMIANFDILCPPIEIQESIVGILSTYDALIENNQRQIKLLEEAAQRLYKEWFVDLRFPGHENTKITDGVPEGWSNAAVTDLLEIKYGKDHKALEDGLIPVYGSGGLVRKVNKKLHSGESVLIPRKGSLNNLLLVNGDFWAIDTMFFGVPRKPNVAKYVYLFLSGLDMYAMNIGAAVPSMTVKILEGMRVLYPVEDVLEQFEKMVGPLFLLIELLKKKSESLADARDLLLPKLMSGELEV